MNRRSRAALVLSTLLSVSVSAQEISRGEYRARRETLLERFADGIVLLHARPGDPELDSHRFKQNPSFFYFTGLARQPAAILALDGPKHETTLFVPDPPRSFGFPVDGVSLAPGTSSAGVVGVDRVVHFREFRGWLDGRMAAGVRTLYLDESRHPVMPGNPDDLLPMAGEATLWRRAIEEAFPSAKIASAERAIRGMRWVKSAAEIAVLRQVAHATALALADGIHAVQPGVRQRDAEAAVVAGCIAAGAEGPAFWPWTMSGPNARVSGLVRSLYDYHHLDRTMREGEVVRLDVGCDYGFYEGDVGRTVPVSGRFTPGQGETWDLLVTAYRAGLEVIRAGLTHGELAAVARRRVRELEPSLRTDVAREAARALVGGGDDLWHVHGVGIESGEERLERLEAGSVIAFEPMVEAGGDAFYLEDMILVTETGHEVLSRGLPYTAEEIEKVMGSR